MTSSYKSTIDFGEIIHTITFVKNPNVIVEFGILNGYSLNKLISGSSSTCNITAYDFFEDFNGNHSDRSIVNDYTQDNVNIEHADFYKKYIDIPDNSIDLLHIDIANTGETYEFVFKYYISKMKKDGIILLEGGSDERDRVDWMKKYNKPKIRPVIEKYSNDYSICTLFTFPSMTIIRL
jgi:predicted O-methyltransferase YrrM